MRRHEGCQSYTRADGPLIAHAGGGLPDHLYPNNLEALNLASAHGHTLIELDFIERDGQLLIGHDSDRMSDMTLVDLMHWLDQHATVSIVTDIKTENLSGLRLLKAAAGRRLSRFIAQIYSPKEYEPTVALGFSAPILTIYRLGDQGWQGAANAMPLRAVTMPIERAYLSKGIRHPVFLHTVNRPIKGYGLYTDCLIPN